MCIRDRYQRRVHGVVQTAQSWCVSMSGGAFGGGDAAKTLVSFKAGKLDAKESSGGKFSVKPQDRKGEVHVVRGQDQLIHFQWKDRVSNAVVDDLIVMPDELEFTKVNTGRSQDRVYLLQVKNSARRFFYWMQDKDTTKDEQLAKTVTQCLGHNPPSAPPAEGDSLTNMIR
eukprot:TRINITY_DN3950_c0_g2_i5.p1 TRINITY_DN3950_c0_g2~~TRINITY_DN3950_c0_g2_i5.p1  ORF type:complete len:171 (-),score=42.74 TRINITY_DN3950_c0_g2_i5:385-897(-)